MSRVVRVVASLAGILLSVYSLYVEHQKDLNPGYIAGCDFSATWSCSKVFESKWGTGFGVVGDLLGEDHILNQPNGVLGIVHYSLVLLLGGSSKPLWLRRLVFLANVAGAWGCCYLAYILYFVLEDACVVCLSLYVVQLTLLIITYLDLQKKPTITRKKQS
eukprot:g55805.t1